MEELLSLPPIVTTDGCDDVVEDDLGELVDEDLVVPDALESGTLSVVPVR